MKKEKKQCVFDKSTIRPIFETLKAAKYEVQKPSTCRVTLFRCRFWVDVSRFSPCVINLSINFFSQVEEIQRADWLICLVWI